MSTLRFGDTISLVFTKVLDQVNLGLVDEDEEVEAVTDRAYWEERSSKEIVAMADEVLGIIKKLDPELELKYNKFYIGLAKHDQPNNFVIFRPRKGNFRIEPRLDQSAELEKKLEEAGLDVMDYDKRWSRYRIRLTKSDLKKHTDLLTDLLQKAYKITAE